ncbi:enoyl-CoA hydratase/isomerase family protein [Tsukamurella sp. PLM1]|uniref:enoyl-CoA hydratase/isomerase family protein n=1 Tax=Tsukamurella sp. PLM1 TaxID=2929795 RepID=UPI0020BDD258|nr:enoyl-CoA hydratase-related protein [Tsukamurella sp. PLM1]
MTLNRPEQRNALSDEVLSALDRITQAPLDGVRAVVIRGNGTAFCAGGDIKQFARDLQSADPATIAAYNRRFGTILQRLTRAPVPVIAAIHGAAMGGGMGFAAAADITLATADTAFSLTETTLGLVPAQICPFVVDRLGAHTARRLMLTAARFRAPEAYRLGLVDEVVDDLDAAVDTLVDRIRRCAPGANALTKRLVTDCTSVDMTTVLDDAARLFGKVMLSAEARTGVDAFLSGGSPGWATDSSRAATEEVAPQ